jgi:hypothetical protein
MRSRPPTLSPRRTAVPRKLLTIKAAAAALVAVLSIGGVAAAAGGLLPDQASPVADQATATTGADAAAQGLGKAAAANLGGSANAGPADDQGRTSAAGPGCAGPGRPAREPTMARGWTQWRSRPWPRPPAAPTTSPPTARTSPPAAAPTLMGTARRRRRASRHRPAAPPRTRALPPAPALEGMDRAAPQPPPADRSRTAYSGSSSGANRKRGKDGEVSRHPSALKRPIGWGTLTRSSRSTASICLPADQLGRDR